MNQLGTVTPDALVKSQVITAIGIETACRSTDRALGAVRVAHTVREARLKWGGAMHFEAVALPFAIAADAVQAACQWTHRAGTPYIACDTSRVGLRPPIREPVPAPDVQPPRSQRCLSVFALTRIGKRA